ncbi:MAG TPA: hypothetical protein VNI54_04035 [Thermoanaerobaculia bacterium]|nr:hypothetical protein [Thermoanaerobaculia bacterium]
MTRRARLSLFASVLGLALWNPTGLAQTTATGLARLDFMLGEWQGTSRGEPGEGKIERVCAKVLDDRFVECRTTVTYPAQAANPKGEVHVDRALFSYDKSTKNLRLRQFHGEGFVNTYAEGDPLSFVTTEIENIPAGWRARETYESWSPDSWSERFELAGPGKDFKLYSASTLQRVKTAASTGETKPATIAEQAAEPLWRFDTHG